MDNQATIKETAKELSESAADVDIDVKQLFSIIGGGSGSRMWSDARLAGVFRYLLKK